MPITDEELDTRWQQCEARQHYLEWGALETYLRALSRLARADNKHATATRLEEMARKAHQIRMAMQPKGEPS